MPTVQDSPFFPLRRVFRLSGWCITIFGIAVCGMALRKARRWMRRPPRIWHGMYPLHSTRYMVEADRLGGYPSRSVVHHIDASYAMVTKQEFDCVLQRPGISRDDVHWLALLDLLYHADIWVAFFECLFFRSDQTSANLWVFHLIRWMGIRIVVVAHGGDIHHRTPQVTRFDVMRRLQLDYPDWDLTAHRAIAEARIRLFCKFADLVLPGDSFLARLLPRKDIVFKYFPIDCDALQPGGGGQSVPVVMHAPNHRLTKGSDFLIAAVDRLKAKGISCRLELVEKVPREQALRLYREADIVAEQFCAGAFGQFALEGLALGKPVLTYLDQEHLGDPVFNLPLVNTTPDNLEQVLAVLLQVPLLRERLGQAGRASVERYQSIPALADVWSRIYRHLWWGEPLDLQETRHFSAERAPRSFTENPSQADFWPVFVDDLLPAIHAALARAEFVDTMQETGVQSVRVG